MNFNRTAHVVNTGQLRSPRMDEEWNHLIGVRAQMTRGIVGQYIKNNRGYPAGTAEETVHSFPAGEKAAWKIIQLAVVLICRTAKQ